jgi:hypothetical protein
MGYDIRQVTGQVAYRAITELRYAVYASEDSVRAHWAIGSGFQPQP